jgi:hypothetical protein
MRVAESVQQLPLWYELDANNCVVAVSEYWDVHAMMYQTPSLLAKNIIGKPLDSQISGDVTQMFTDTMITSARVQSKSLTRRYRCDSPTHKREMEMVLTPMANGHLRIAHQLIEETPWQHHRRLRTQAPNATGRAKCRLKRCSMCNDLLDGDEWVSQDVYLARHPEQDKGSLAVFYGICPRCAQGVQTDV